MSVDVIPGATQLTRIPSGPSSTARQRVACSSANLLLEYAAMFALAIRATVEPTLTTTPLPARSAGLLSEGDRIDVKAGPEGARFLVLAGKPIREPVVQHGPFVMNTREEIEQAIRDYQSGELAAAR